MNRFATIAVAAAGILHIAVAPQHYQHAPAHAIFFVVAGIAEIVWALIFLRRPTQQVYYVGLALTGGLILLWALTRVVPAPFHGHAEAIDLGGIACKVSEVAGLAALLMIAAQGGITGLAKQSMARLAAIALMISAAVAGATYVAARAAEPLLPSLSASDHHEETEHEHEEGEHEHEHEGEHKHEE
jgi:hypothetical protein